MFRRSSRIFLVWWIFFRSFSAVFYLDQILWSFWISFRHPVYSCNASIYRCSLVLFDVHYFVFHYFVFRSLLPFSVHSSPFPFSPPVFYGLLPFTADSFPFLFTPYLWYLLLPFSFVFSFLPRHQGPHSHLALFCYWMGTHLQNSPFSRFATFHNSACLPSWAIFTNSLMRSLPCDIMNHIIICGLRIPIFSKSGPNIFHKH